MIVEVVDSAILYGMAPLLHPQEKERLDAVKSLHILDSAPDPHFDEITREAITRLHVPISTVSIIDENREWFKSCQGLESTEGPREIAFCNYAMLAKDIFIVEDTYLDERFRHNPYVIGKPFVRFYAGIALTEEKSRLPVGVFCIKDIKPRKFTMEEMEIFLELAKKAEKLINTATPTPHGG